MFIYFLCGYYNHEWLNEDSQRLAPHQDKELTHEIKKCFKRYFDDAVIRRHRVCKVFKWKRRFFRC